MAIAKYPPLKNVSHEKQIPGNWTSLYQPTRLPPPEFEKHLKAGDIHPDLERKDIAKWLPKKTHEQLPMRGAASALIMVPMGTISHRIGLHSINSPAFD